MKILKITAIATAVLAASSFSQMATAEVTANVAATSNYLWRGLEQTGGDAAVSGGIDYAGESGFYAGTWASNASWGDMKTELDLYLGFGGDISEGVSYDVGFIYYAYPDSVSGDADFSEIYGSISVSGFTLGLAVLADGEGADAGDTVYVNLDYGIALESGAEIGLHIGDYSGDWLAADSTDIGASVSKDGFTFGVSKLINDDNGAGTDDAKFYVAYSVDFTL